MKVEIRPRDEGGLYPYLLLVDGLVRRVGSEFECLQLGQILASAGGDREAQDQALKRAV